MRNFIVAVVSGTHNGEYFACGLEFNFNPPICTMAADKVRSLFINRNLEKCQSLAKAMGFEFKVLPPAKEPIEPRPIDCI